MTRGLRTAAVALAVAGGLTVPGVAFAQIRDCDAACQARLEEIKRSMAPAPYKPPPSACERWKGREFIARYDPDHKPNGCIAQCAVKLAESNGGTARWQITGAPCKTR